MIGVRDTGDGQGIGIPPALLFTIRNAGRERYRSSGKREEIAGQIQGRADEFVSAPVSRREQNVVENFRGKVPETQEVGARDTVRAAGRGIDCISHPLEIRDIGGTVDRGVLPPAYGSFPMPGIG